MSVAHLAQRIQVIRNVPVSFVIAADDDVTTYNKPSLMSEEQRRAHVKKQRNESSRRFREKQRIQKLIEYSKENKGKRT